MKTFSIKSLFPHAIAIGIFLLITYIYFAPLLAGKRLNQSDTMQWRGSAQELIFWKDKTGEQPLWTNSMFGGMPAYLIAMQIKSNLINYVFSFFDTLLVRPASMLIIALVGFYILLLAFGCEVWLAMVGAIAFAFSSYFFIIIEAGHNTKAFAIAYFPYVMAGIVYVYNGRYWLGAIITSVFVAQMFITQHMQIIYYALIIIFIYGLMEFYKTILEKNYKKFFKATGIVIIAALLGVATNITNILVIREYAPYSMRGKSELTNEKENKTTGLDKDYATAWSYGIAETFTLLIPNFMGGSSTGELNTSSETFKILEDRGIPNAREIIKHLPLYWGDQPFTSGTIYVGAIIVFLFVLGLFIIKGSLKWWLLSATIIGIVLSWGKNFMGLTEFLLDYLPGYNKFRTVSMILVIAEFSMPLLAALTLKQIFENKISKDELIKYLKYSLYILGGIILIFIIMPSLFFDFTSPSDAQLAQSGWPDFLITALRNDRKAMLQNDAFRSLFFIVLSAALIWAFISQKTNYRTTVILIGLLVLIDMWSVNKRYLNNENFTNKSNVENPFTPTQADLQILQDTDLNYRVINYTVNTFNDATTSYFHKSLGGYHGAKMKRYQELIDHHISKQNMAVFNMLNTKYFIIPSKETKEPVVQRNPMALGNAWFVEQYKLVPNADSEILALNNFNPAKEAIIDIRFKNQLNGFKYTYDTTASIKLVSYKPDHLVYQSKTNSEQLAVFSEIYYDPAWTAYIDGKEVPHFRANYILRAMRIPAGNHKIEFIFKSKSYIYGERISLTCSIITLLLMVGGLFNYFIRKK